MNCIERPQPVGTEKDSGKPTDGNLPGPSPTKDSDTKYPKNDQRQ